MKPTMLKTAFTVVLAGLSSYFGMLTQPLLVLFFAMVLDYLTGMTKAYGNTAQKSRRDTARSDIIRPWINR